MWPCSAGVQNLTPRIQRNNSSFEDRWIKSGDDGKASTSGLAAKCGLLSCGVE